jgi:hypothetical protein
LLEPALGLFPHQMLALDGGPGLDKGGSLLLELGLRLLGCDPFLPELLLRRGERGGLVRQASPQLLCLLYLLFGLALPSTRSLEGRAVLLELGPNGGHLGLPLRCCRMDLPGPTTSVGTRTDYSVGPWDYPTCAARYLLA